MALEGRDDNAADRRIALQASEASSDATVCAHAPIPAKLGEILEDLKQGPEEFWPQRVATMVVPFWVEMEREGEKKKRGKAEEREISDMLWKNVRKTYTRNSLFDDFWCHVPLR